MDDIESRREDGRRYEWSNLDSGFAFVSNELIISTLGLNAELVRMLRVLPAENSNRAIIRLLADAWNPNDDFDDQILVEAYAEWQRHRTETVREDFIGVLDIFTARMLLEVRDIKTSAGFLVADSFVLVRGEFDVVTAVSRLRALGLRSQPNHVFQLHGDCCCGPHPAGLPSGGAMLVLQNGTGPSGSLSGISGGVAMRGIKGAVAMRGIKGAVAMRGIKGGASSALPVPVPPLAPLTNNLAWPPSNDPKVVILDSGFPTSDLQLSATTNAGGPLDAGDNPPSQGSSGDGFLDDAGGHGGFIASIIERFAPSTNLQIQRVLDTVSNGLIDEVDACTAIDHAVQLLKGQNPQADGVISISFGGPVWEHAAVLESSVAAAQIAGAVVVASAGNDATCEPQYPAALPGVVSVGAIGPDGPAEFTNYGPWVRCCAPGVDVVGKFYNKDFGAAPNTGGDPDDFEGWAMWSGTSFAVPMVVAAILRDMAYNKRTAQDAVKAVIDAPHLGRIPGLGTVVNV